MITSISVTGTATAFAFMKAKSWDDGIEQVNTKLDSYYLRDSARYEIMQLQMIQLRNEMEANRQFILSNREILKDIRDTQITP